jgi:hypothetical protein
MLTAFWCICLALLETAAASVHPSSSSSPIITIPLDKQYVPVKRNNRTVSYKTAYFGRIFLGLPKPQNFTILFDTGSGHFFLPSSKCPSAACRRHRRYRRSLSASAVDLDHEGGVVPADIPERDQVAVAYGTGEIVGEFVRETVCLTDREQDSARSHAAEEGSCTRLRVILATEMSSDPFENFEFDGVLGLGLESLVVDPEFSFFGQMMQQHKLREARFGYFLSRNDAEASEISFGGHDERRVASELQWAPVHRPELGYWQVRVRSVMVGNTALDLCEAGGCVAIADTGTSLIGVPRPVSQHLHWLLARKVPDDPSEIDCREFPGPDLVFDLDGVKLTLGPEDYSRPTAMRVLQKKTNLSQTLCRASLLPVDGDSEVLGPKAWILGEPVLRKYYTAYDYRRQQVGFSLAVQSERSAGTKLEASATDADGTLQRLTHTVYGKPPPEPPTPAIVVV